MTTAKTKTKRKAYKKEKVTDNPIDIYIGKRLRQFRWLQGISQQQLAKKIGLKFQQIQKYETSANRISLSRAVKICDALNISINALMGEYADKKESPFMKMLDSRNALMLGRAYMQLSEKKRRKVLEFAGILLE